MLGMREQGVLYRRAGQRGARPVYEETGVAFPCRTQPRDARSYAGRIAGVRAAGRSAEARGEALIFAPPMEAAVGDRIVLEDGTYILAELRLRRGLNGRAHHLELLAVAEEGAS